MKQVEVEVKGGRMLEVRGWMLEVVDHVLASNLLSLSLNLSLTLADFFSILLVVTSAWAAGALCPLTPCRSPSIMLGHAVVEYPEFRDAGFAICPVRVGPLHG